MAYDKAGKFVMMKIGSDSWIEMVLQGAERLGVAVDEDQASLFARHARLLIDWNRKLNLTAIIDPAEVAVKHVLDAIAPLAHIPSDGRLLDIGTGGGFPGIPLKILRPTQPMLLIDGVRKKINFVKHVIRELSLASIEARQVRAETLAREAMETRFDIIVCRALSDLRQVMEWAAPLLSPGGRVVAYRGPNDAQTAATQDADPDSLRVQHRLFQSTRYSYRLPVLGDPRTVTVITSV